MDYLQIADKLGLIKFSQKEKFYLLNYIRAISKSGQDEKKAVANKLYEYKQRKKFILEHILKKVKVEVDKGKSFADALKTSGIINDREFHILRTAKGSLANGIDKIIETNQKSSKSMAGFLLLFIPPSIMLLTLLFTHDMVKDVLNAMMNPIVSSGGTPPPMADYLVSNTMYIFFNSVYFSILIGGIVGMQIVKNYYPKKYLKIIPIIEEEYVMDILKSLKAITTGGGINMANAAKALSTGESNNVKYLLLQKIVERTSLGKEKISEVFEEFGANYNTISALKLGEDSNNINLGLDIAIEDIETRYKRDIKFFITSCMWGGQLGMIGIAGKPMIDIMLLMSVGQLNFEL